MKIVINKENIIVSTERDEKSMSYKNKYELVYWILEEIFHYLETEGKND